MKKPPPRPNKGTFVYLVAGSLPPSAQDGAIDGVCKACSLHLSCLPAIGLSPTGRPLHVSFLRLTYVLFLTRLATLLTPPDIVEFPSLLPFSCGASWSFATLTQVFPSQTESPLPQGQGFTPPWRFLISHHRVG